MKINLENFDIRRSAPRLEGIYSLPENVERYIVKAQGLIGIDIFSGDKIKIINTEGGQICEVAVFDKSGKNNQSIIGKQNDGEAKFTKYLLTNSDDKKILIDKLKKKKNDQKMPFPSCWIWNSFFTCH